MATVAYVLTPTPIRVINVPEGDPFQAQNRGPGPIYIAASLASDGEPDTPAELLSAHIVEELGWFNFARAANPNPNERIYAWSGNARAHLIITEGHR